MPTKLFVSVIAVGAILLGGAVAIRVAVPEPGEFETGIEPADQQIELSKPEFVKRMCAEFKPAFKRYTDDLKKKSGVSSADLDAASIARYGADFFSFWLAVTSDLNEKYRYSGEEGRRASDNYPAAVEGARESIEHARPAVEAGLGEFQGSELKPSEPTKMALFAYGADGTLFRGDQEVVRIKVGDLFVAYALDPPSKSAQPSNYLRALEPDFRNEPACEALADDLN